ncbi:MAG: DUF1801 domain-containing protein [Ferruginibacter sp.]
MTIETFILQQPIERQNILSKIHEIIISNDKTVTANIAPMMGKEMIIYNAPGSFKYGLASAKQYMSLHVLPIYCSEKIYTKYKALLNKATFKKGCINFNTNNEMPLKIVKQLIKDCALIDLKALKETYAKEKRIKKP